MRDDAWAGELEDAVWIEVGADLGADPTDRKQWAKANPSYPHRTPAESILRLQRKLAADSFLREGLGLWDETIGVPDPPVMSVERWAALTVESAPSDGAVAYGVKFSPAGDLIALAAAVKPETGPVHVEGIKVAPTADGTRWLVTWLAARSAPVAIDGRAGAGALAVDLRKAGVPVRRVHRVTVDEAIAAATGMVNAVAAGDVTHLDDPALAVDDVIRRPIGKTGGWGFGGRGDADVSLHEAASLARWAVAQRKTARPGSRRVAVPG